MWSSWSLLGQVVRLEDLSAVVQVGADVLFYVVILGTVTSIQGYRMNARRGQRIK